MSALLFLSLSLSSILLPMAMYAGAAALGAAVLLSSQKQAQAAAPAGSPPVWGRMRWTDYAWQMILPYANMHPPAPPGQTAGGKDPQTGAPVKSSGVWLYWPIGPTGYATSNDGRQEGNLVGQAGQYLYVWFPRTDELQNINGYWIYHQANHHKPPPPAPPSAPPGQWSVRGGNRNYLVWITAQNAKNDAMIKQFAWFRFHQGATAGEWRSTPVEATSAAGVSLPDETDSTGKMLFLLTPQQAQADAAVLQLAGNAASPTAAAPPDVAPSAGASAASAGPSA